MEIEIVDEYGLESALIGMKFSFQQECAIADISWELEQDAYRGDTKVFKEYDRYCAYKKTADKLCKRDMGHNKFLEQIQVWMIIRAPLYFWKQFDTYRVGTSKLSKSTMHTLVKRHITFEDFECGNDTLDMDEIDKLNYWRKARDFDTLNKLLPQSFLQTRMVNTNYKVLRNIIMQRSKHKLTEWDDFCAEMYNQLQNPELLGLGE